MALLKDFVSIVTCFKTSCSLIGEANWRPLFDTATIQDTAFDRPFGGRSLLSVRLRCQRR